MMNRTRKLIDFILLSESLGLTTATKEGIKELATLHGLIVTGDTDPIRVFDTPALDELLKTGIGCIAWCKLFRELTYGMAETGKCLSLTETKKEYERRRTLLTKASNL